MLHRVIPILTLENKQLVKTKNFKQPKYIGDPINALKIFNEKEVDELVILDIGASKNKTAPNYEHIYQIASEAFIPIAYGGGVNTLDMAKKIFNCGVEKIVLNTALFEQPQLTIEIANLYGSQSVVASIDYKKTVFKKQQLVYKSATKTAKLDIFNYVSKLEEMGVGEIFLHCVDRDGCFAGYDTELIEKLTSQTNLPLVAVGGAKNLEDIDTVVNHYNAHAAGASSIFVFKNNNRDSILINYPTR